jgi:hypothetical protein
VDLEEKLCEVLSRIEMVRCAVLCRNIMYTLMNFWVESLGISLAAERKYQLQKKSLWRGDGPV